MKINENSPLSVLLYSCRFIICNTKNGQLHGSYLRLVAHPTSIMNPLLVKVLAVFDFLNKLDIDIESLSNKYFSLHASDFRNYKHRFISFF